MPSSLAPDELLLYVSDRETVDAVVVTFAYLVVSGGKGGKVTLDVGVSTTAALLVIVNVASLFLVSEFCWFVFSTLLFIGPDEGSPFDDDAGPLLEQDMLLLDSPDVLGR